MSAIYVLSVLLVCSIAINITQVLKNRRRKANLTIEAKDLIHDITKHGQALVRIQVLDPEGLFLTKSGR